MSYGKPWVANATINPIAVPAPITPQRAGSRIDRIAGKGYARAANTIGLVAEPLVSVVVSTYNRPDRLARLLSALCAQTLPRAAFEVVVVDNGSGPETGAVLARESSRD